MGQLRLQASHDFEEREAGVLLVVGAEAAVVGAAVFDGRVVVVGHLRRLDEDFAAAAVVVDVVGHEDALEAVLGAALEHEDVVVFEDDLGVDAAEAGGADGDGGVVEEVVAGLGHVVLTLSEELKKRLHDSDQADDQQPEKAHEHASSLQIRCEGKEDICSRRER